MRRPDYLLWKHTDFIRKISLPNVSVALRQTFFLMQVSICKFKFTGGAKPTLEEKKMMSVDSGGNFRYYSGDNSVHKGAF